MTGIAERVAMGRCLLGFLAVLGTQSPGLQSGFGLAFDATAIVLAAYLSLVTETRSIVADMAPLTQPAD
jgi:hypothetical protein